MAVKRYELNEAQWSRIASLLPGKAVDPGRTGTDNRLFVNECLWVLRSGAHWRDLPDGMANGKRSIVGSVAGVMPGYGNGSLMRSQQTGIINT